MKTQQHIQSLVMCGVCRFLKKTSTSAADIMARLSGKSGANPKSLSDCAPILDNSGTKPSASSSETKAEESVGDGSRVSFSIQSKPVAKSHSTNSLIDSSQSRSTVDSSGANTSGDSSSLAHSNSSFPTPGIRIENLSASQSSLPYSATNAAQAHYSSASGMRDSVSSHAHVQQVEQAMQPRAPPTREPNFSAMVANAPPTRQNVSVTQMQQANSFFFSNPGARGSAHSNQQQSIFSSQGVSHSGSPHGYSQPLISANGGTSAMALPVPTPQATTPRQSSIIYAQPPPPQSPRPSAENSSATSVTHGEPSAQSSAHSQRQTTTQPNTAHGQHVEEPSTRSSAHAQRQPTAQPNTVMYTPDAPSHAAPAVRMPVSGGGMSQGAGGGGMFAGVNFAAPKADVAGNATQRHGTLLNSSRLT